MTNPNHEQEHSNHGNSESQWYPEHNELHINLTALINTPCTVILIGWQRGITWSVIVDGETEYHCNPFEPSLFPIEFIAHSCLEPWVKQIPTDVVALLQRYHGNAFGMLMMLSRYQTALNLLREQPTLFWLLFRQAMQNSWTEAEFIAHCEQEPIELLRVCQLPATMTALQVLNKVTASQFAQHQQELIGQLFLCDYEALNGRDAIPDHLLRFLFRYSEFWHSELMRHWQGNHYGQLINLIASIKRGAVALRLEASSVMQQVYDCHNLQAVESLHDLLRQRQTDLVLQTYADLQYNASVATVAFPAPPLEGTEDIVPITSFAMLLKESQLLGHILVSFSNKIAAGNYYAYQVFYPERATLLLTLFRSEEGQLFPVIKELITFNSQPVHQETRQLVLDWLNRTAAKT